MERLRQWRESSPAKGSTMRAGSYHHGDLRRTLLRAAAEQVAATGAAGLRMRELARRTGVSHTAASHHFKDRTGLLTALAVEGFELLRARMEPAADLLEAGVAYVDFAADHPAHFEVMFQPRLYRAGDEDVRQARESTQQVLTARLSQHGDADGPTSRLAAWSIVHGYAHLWLAGAIERPAGVSAGQSVRAVLERQFAW